MISINCRLLLPAQLDEIKPQVLAEYLIKVYSRQLWLKHIGSTNQISIDFMRQRFSNYRFICYSFSKLFRHQEKF